LLCFHLSVDAISNWTISKFESTVSHYLKKWLNLPCSATRVILYYPGVVCTSITHVSREAKLSLISCVSSSSDYCLQEFGLQLKLGKAHLQTSDADYSVLKSAREQLSLLGHCIIKLSIYCLTLLLLSVKLICRLFDSAQLERSYRTWHCLMSGFHPGHLSFLLRAASDTLPTALRR